MYSAGGNAVLRMTCWPACVGGCKTACDGCKTRGCGGNPDGCEAGCAGCKMIGVEGCAGSRDVDEGAAPMGADGVPRFAGARRCFFVGTF